MKLCSPWVSAFVIVWLSMIAAAAGAADQEIDTAVQRYRESLQDSSPAELWVLRGEGLFREKRGPRKASLETCDFGLGAGIVKGAYARLPRYFADTGRVEDLESRLMTCMGRLQGFSAEAFPRHAPSDPDRMADLARLAAYVASESAGLKLEAPLSHPKEIEAYRVGELLFHRRAGSHDFSCATCHATQGKRIRLQRLAQLTDPKDAQRALPTWPAYSVGPGDMLTMQHWIALCYYQSRHPQLRYGSDAAIALQVFLAQHANGGVIAAPGTRR